MPLLKEVDDDDDNVLLLLLYPHGVFKLILHFCIQNCCTAKGHGSEKYQTEIKMTVAPSKNSRPSGVANNSMLNVELNTTLTPVAKPLSTLSAYLITAATSKPPPA